MYFFASALGVGVNVVDPPDPESNFREKQPPFELAGPLSVDLLTSRAPSQEVSTNIMRTLMDQGQRYTHPHLIQLTPIAGTLVQLDLNAADASESRVLTRVMGELSSGTQLGPPVPGLPIDSSTEIMGDPRELFRMGTYSTDSSPTVITNSRGVDDVIPLSATSSTSTRSEPPVRKSSHGSKTSLSLPMSRTPSVAPFDPPIIVLVVDDDRLTRTVMSRMLTRLGCTVLTAENGEVALELIISRTSRTEDGGNPKDLVSSNDSERDPGIEGGEGAENTCAYDVVFLDNQMPVMSGLEMISALREIGRDDFVVGVTGQCCSGSMSLRYFDAEAGNALIDDQKEYSKAGVDQYVDL